MRRDAKRDRVAAVIDQTADPVTGLPTEALAPAPAAIAEMAQGAAQQYNSTGPAFKALMPDLVKGAGYRGPGGNKPLEDQMEITTRATKATLDMRTAAAAGYRNKAGVVKSLNPAFLNKFGAMKAALERPGIAEHLQQFMGAVANPDVVRSFTAGNLAIGSVYGLTPFNLLN